MSVYSIWESSFPAGSHEEGAAVTRAIWADMAEFDGYLDHEIVEDLAHPGHLLVLSRWKSREAADAAMVYRSSPNARRADALVSDPRRRTLGRVIDAGGAG
ncbi:MAG TPA: antibiotic biosynthesis monooxygenase [Thermoleophilaceae bacterium]|jgi:heme-degrading monooxygenase HmoA